MKHRLLTLLMGLALSGAALADAADRLVERLSQVQALEAGFEQVTLDRQGNPLQQSTGDMLVARPSQFRWHAREPFEQLIVSNGERVQIYDVDLEQVVDRGLDRQVGSTPALLFSGQPRQVAEEFHVQELAREGERVTWALSPRGEEPLFNRLEVTFEGPLPVAMRLEDALGQHTRIRFLAPKLNGRPDPSRFHFTPPDGTDVIREP